MKFYASLGNHDDPTQRFYKPFNMNGERYYTFTKGDVALLRARQQLHGPAAAEVARGAADAARTTDWKIAFFHHPLYSSGGTHGSEVDLRTCSSRSS